MRWFALPMLQVWAIIRTLKFLSIDTFLLRLFCFWLLSVCFFSSPPHPQKKCYLLYASVLSYTGLALQLNASRRIVYSWYVHVVFTADDMFMLFSLCNETLEDDFFYGRWLLDCIWLCPNTCTFEDIEAHPSSCRSLFTLHGKYFAMLKTFLLGTLEVQHLSIVINVYYSSISTWKLATMESVRGVNVPMYTTLRRTTVVFTMVVEFILAGQKYTSSIVGR